MARPAPCRGEMLAHQPLRRQPPGAVTTDVPLTKLGKVLAVCRGGRWPGHAAMARSVLTKEWAMRGLTRILRCERGANAIEFALVACLIAIAAYAAFINLGDKVEGMFNNVSNQMPSN